MLSVVKQSTAGENIIEHIAEDTQLVRMWLYWHGLTVKPGVGWVNEDNTKMGAIHHDGGKKVRGVIWIAC